MKITKEEYLKLSDDNISKKEYDSIIGKIDVRFNEIMKSIVVAGSEQVVIFVSFMWMLVKAKKQKACPYFLFTDPIDKK